MEKNQLRQRVIDRLRELDVGAVEAAKSVPGLERNYIRDFVLNKKQSFSSAKIPLVAQALKLSANELTDFSSSQTVTKVRPSDASPTLDRMQQSHDGFSPKEIIIPRGEADMPLYRFANGGKGAPILEAQAIETVRRPEDLERVRDPYGVVVEGTSMSPEFEPGWVAEVNPTLTPRSGDTCIFRGEQADGAQWACIKRFKRETPTAWHVEQHKPAQGEKRLFTLKKSEYQIAHVVTGTNRRRR